MSFFKRLSPAFLPPHATQKGGLQLHREKILQALLIIFCVFGLPSTILAASGAAAEGKIVLPFVYGLIYLSFFWMMIDRRSPYSLRASLIVSVAYLLALTELFESGQLGEMRMFLISFVALTAVLFNYRYAIGAIALGLATILAVGLVASLAPLPGLPSLEQINQGTDWITSMVVYLMLGMMVAGSISMIITSLEANLAEQAQMMIQLEAERNILDQRVKERTQSVENRLNQLRAASEISQAISALADQDLLLQQVTEKLKDRFGLYYVGVFLVEENQQYAVLKAGTGEVGKQMVADGYRLAIGGNSMIGWAVANQTTRIALDEGSEAVRFNNPRLPLTRTEMALPIRAHAEIIGAMSIQSEKANAFDENDITVFKGVADSLAIALENTRLYQEARQNLDEIRVLNRDYLQRAWAETTQVYGSLEYEYKNPSMPAGRNKHEILVPLALRGEMIGEIALEIDREELTPEEGVYLENITTQTAIALENARLFENTVRRAEREKKVLQITARIRSTNDPAEIMQFAIQELQQALGASRTQIYIRQSAAEQEQDTPGNSSVQE